MASSIGRRILHCRKASVVEGLQRAPRMIQSLRTPSHPQTVCTGHRPKAVRHSCQVSSLPTGSLRRVLHSSLEKASYVLQSELRCSHLGNSESEVAAYNDHLSPCHNPVTHHQIHRLRHMPVQLYNISGAEFQHLTKWHIARAELQRRIEFNVAQQTDVRFHVRSRRRSFA